ncbi:MAG: DUF3320 domain-containing protein, partial [Planctomycetaceae bacterium]
EEVLIARGWKIHRIWGTDWYQQPETALKKVLTAIEAVRAGDSPLVETPNSTVERSVPSDSKNEDSPARARVEVSEETTPESDPFGIPVETYQEALSGFTITSSILEMTPAELDKATLKVVAIEGPIHRDELARRLATLAASRAGSRIVEAAKKSITRLIRRNEVTREGEFVNLTQRRESVVRDRSSVTSKTLKKPENIPPSEVALALVLLLKENLSAERSELLKTVAKVLGFGQTSSKFRESAEAVIQHLIATEEIVERNGVLSVGNREKSHERLNVQSEDGQLF